MSTKESNTFLSRLPYHKELRFVPFFSLSYIFLLRLKNPSTSSDVNALQDLCVFMTFPRDIFIELRISFRTKQYTIIINRYILKINLLLPTTKSPSTS